MNSRKHPRAHGSSRREFLTSAMAGAAALAFPTIIPARVLGAEAPSKRIQIAHIGCGRIAREMDMPGILKHDSARMVAVCDLDSKRVGLAKQYIEQYYARKFKQEHYLEVKTYADYRAMLRDPSIDAVAISTPDHWHAQPAIEAALAGKDVYVQKPCSLTIAEGRAVSDTIRRTKRVFLIGSQQRSSAQFHRACELVRNGRIGKLKKITIGLPGDPAGKDEPEMPVPANLNYDMWLGSTPQVYYTEARVHPQKDFGRPGWLRCEQFGAGMITGWGSHHVDIAHWGMGTELTGPVEIEAQAEFPTGGLWNVHGTFHAQAKYANGVTMLLSDKYPNGVLFEGENGWIFVSRGSVKTTASDPITSGKPLKALDASDPKILDSVIGDGDVHLYKSIDHHGDWLDAIQSRKETVAPVEVAHRSCSACLLVHAAMKLGRKLTWDPQAERFVNDAAADALLARHQRAPYGTELALKKHDGNG